MPTRSRTRSRTRRPAPSARGSAAPRRAPRNGRNGSSAARPAASTDARTAVFRQAAWEGQRATWEAKLAKARVREGMYPFTIYGVPIQPIYTPDDLAGFDPARDLGIPGGPPFPRGIH